MKYFVIINPACAHGFGEKSISLVSKALTTHGLDYTLVATEYPWHAAELADFGARKGYDVVVSAGGDGTANEVINGLMLAQSQGMKHTAMGVIPIGTGNDLAASLGLPDDLSGAVVALKLDQRRMIDLGFASGDEFPGGRYFGNCVGIGFDAAGTILSRKITYASGMLAYLIAAIQTIFTYHASAPTVQITYDGNVITQKALMVSIMNGRRIGGGFWTAPQASASDGWLDLCIAQTVNQLRMFSLLPHFIKGTQATQPEIQMVRARDVSVFALNGSLPVQIDGEIVSENGNSLEIEIYPKQLEIVGVPV